MVKVDVISGFLGSGKTTLIRKLLKETMKDEKVVLIENEFGEIGIDGGFLKDAGVEITEMNSGCICCSLVGDFGKALKQVVEKFKPDRIIIEPSGVGKLSDVVHAIEKEAENCGLSVNSATTVCDALKCKVYMKNFGEFYDNQVASAGAILLSRTQNATPEKLEEDLKLLREKNAEAPIITTPWDLLSGERILEVMEESKKLMHELEDDDDDEDEHEHHHEHEHEHHHEHEHEHEHHHEHEHEHEHHHEHGENCTCGCHDHDDHHHHADEVFQSFGKETAKKFDPDELRRALDELSESGEYGIILRAKGIVELSDRSWAYFDLVPGEVDFRSGNADFTGRLCVIGSNLNEEKIEKLFGI